MVDERLAHLLRAGGGLVTWEGVRGAGLSRAAVRWAVDSGALRVLARGAWADTATWERMNDRQRHGLVVRAALHRCPGAVVAAESAAVVWGLPLPGPPPPVPVLLRPRTRDRPERGGRSAQLLARRAWLAEDEVTVVGGLRVTSPERTFVDLARQLSLPWALAVADSVRRREALGVDDLLLAVDRRPAAAGHARAGLAARHASHLVESPLESVARGVQIELGLPVPEVQVWLGRDRPEVRVDMLVREFAVVVEADGRLKYEGPSSRPGQAWADKRRLDDILEMGYDCHRFVAADAHRPTAWGRELLRTFHRSARRMGLPPPALHLPWA